LTSEKAGETDLRLHDKVAIITGSGTGLGKGIAKRFAREGASVVICGRRIDKVQETVEEISGAGGTAIGVQADVADEASVKHLVAETVSHFRAINVLVNNAGVRGAVGDATSMDLDGWWEALRINLSGPLICARHVIPAMKESGGGSIVNIGSMRLVHVKAGAAAYCASKGGLIHLTKVMALDHAADNIRVNLLRPALVLTPFTQYVVDDFDDPEEGIRYFGAQYPLGRIGTEEDIANAALFLASDESSWVTGAHLNVDGGMGAK